MIVRLSVELFDATTQEEDRLLRKLLTELDDDSLLHALLLDPDDDAVGDERVLRWAAGLDDSLRRSFEQLVAYGPLVSATRCVGAASHSVACWRRSGPLEVWAQRREQSDWRGLRLALQDTLDLLREPLHLHLENDRHDLRFLHCLSSTEARRELDQLERAPNRLHVHGGGTGALQAWLNKLQGRPLIPSELRRLWRSWVMMDMDAGEQSALEPSDTIRGIVSSCEAIYEEHGIPLTWVCLQRREIESYLPDSALRTRDREKAAQVAALRARPNRAPWAWAFDMKRGLRGDLLPHVSKERRAQLSNPGQAPQPDELKAPFDQLDPRARRHLAQGFGGGVLNGPLSAERPPPWLDEIGLEYDRGPLHQLPRAELIQSLFDRV